MIPIVVAFFSVISSADELTFQLTRGIGACSNLPQASDNFECKAIGWPDQDSRIDLIKQEFVDKNGKQVRLGQFDYYYFFKGSKKCEPHKAMILSHLKERKDISELLTGLGTDQECIRQGRGWIQTRNVEIWKAPTPKEHKIDDETRATPKEDYIIPKATVDQKLKKMDASLEYEGKAKSSPLDGMTLEVKKGKTTVIKYDEEREPQSVPKSSKPMATERLPKEYF